MKPNLKNFGDKVLFEQPSQRNRLLTAVNALPLDQMPLMKSLFDQSEVNYSALIQEFMQNVSESDSGLRNKVDILFFMIPFLTRETEPLYAALARATTELLGQYSDNYLLEGGPDLHFIVRHDELPDEFIQTLESLPREEESLISRYLSYLPAESYVLKMEVLKAAKNLPDQEGISAYQSIIVIDREASQAQRFKFALMFDAFNQQKDAFNAKQALGMLSESISTGDF